MNTPLAGKRPLPGIAPASRLRGGDLGLVVGLLLVTWILASALPVVVVGLFFIAAYIAISAVRPAAALILMLGAAPFNHDVGGLPIKISISDLCLVAATLALIPRWLSSGARVTIAPFTPPIVAYLIICVLSTALTGFASEAVTSVAQMTIYMVVAVFFFADVVKPEEVLQGLYALIFTNCFLALMLVVGGSNYVLGLHKNAAGTVLAVGYLLTLTLWLSARMAKRRSPYITAAFALISVGLLLTLSRGAWLGALCGSVVTMILLGQTKLMIRAVAIAVPMLAVAWALVPEDQREYATDFSRTAYNINARFVSIEFALEQFYSSPVIGVGVGLRKMYDATNVVMSTLAETGILGIISFLGIFAALAYSARYAQRRLPRNSLVFSLVVVGAAVMVSKFTHGLADHYWSRGILPIWAGAGLVAAGYASAQARTLATNPSKSLKQPDPLPKP